MARSASRAHHGSFIYQRPEKSPFWYVKTRHGGKRIEVSLHTTDKAQAQINAAPYITAHREALIAARPVFETVHRFAPGRQHIVDGQTVIATDRDLIWINADGSTRTEPNAQQVASSVPRLGLFVPVPIETNVVAFVAPIKGVTKDPDDEIFDHYLEHAKNGALQGHALREAKETWVTFKKLIDKPLKNCSRDDGYRLAAFLKDQGVKSATVKKKIARLCAAVNLAVKDGRPINPDKPDGPKWGFNPFSGVAPVIKGKKGDVTKRVPFSPTDIETIKANLSALSASDQILARLLATTGLRLGEAFEIDHEEKEHGIRFVIVGTKTPSSERRVPLPADFLEYQPTPITGKLFTGDANSASKRLMKFLRDVCMIEDKAKVAYSFRHLAKDRLRSFECPEKIAEAIFGRDEVTVGDDYGKGFPVAVLKKWIDKISF